jgi:LysM repeat protein
VSGSKSPAPLRPRPRLGRFIIHEVKDGETLSRLAGRYLHSTSRFNEIYRANRDVLKDPNSIRPGMKLKIPIKSNGKQNTLRTTSAKTGKSKKSVAASKLGTAGGGDSSRNQTAGKKSSGKSRVKRFTQVPPSDLPPQ